MCLWHSAFVGLTRNTPVLRNIFFYSLKFDSASDVLRIDKEGGNGGLANASLSIMNILARVRNFLTLLGVVLFYQRHLTRA